MGEADAVIVRDDDEERSRAVGDAQRECLQVAILELALLRIPRLGGERGDPGADIRIRGDRPRNVQCRRL